MKGIEMTLINLVILVLALAILTLVIIKLLPSIGNFMAMTFKNIKTSMCKTIGLVC
jgi:Tfp pilus assembly protein PilE